ncbi:protein YgfX [Pseudomonas sp. LFM046]|uniref:protein YgfX n=1 Tax=Pseudomonas sp. LFM046 TaxID=1608357 RepID=UPI0005CFB29C|nr:protein YgfX [Pseudomonas sp. LFM046]
MSSPSEVFECHWRPSRRLLALYLILSFLAVLALSVADVPFWARLAGVLACAAHAAWCLPRQILLTSPKAFTGLRLDGDGWQLWRAADGWRSVQLRPDSLALPQAVILRFRLSGEWWGRGLCIPADALDQEQHRRLRVRLGFSRRRWAEPG